MIGVATGAARVDEALRVVRALGAHRYIVGRLHLVHAFAFAGLRAETQHALAEGGRWARQVLADARIDARSRDESLCRPCSEAELVALFEAYWTPGLAAQRAREGLAGTLEQYGLPMPAGRPFDESFEGAMHPMLIDAGWELLPLAHLDPERHAGAIAAFGDPATFQSAVFAEETAIPPGVSLCELPAIGPAELICGAGDDGLLVEPLVVWAGGNETYLDYVVRGVRRAAKV